ncbi:hypothetical protein C0Z01_20660 [Photobacterium kishitanii]|uniref:Uncharacterized protein n=1 Tax=Photobacterium kishitanii TaxID=318456 RepID=A0A0B7JD16_9GAMM|nr:hypothetical protein [Photobacterium kishitanii]OBU27393.1 hypothetical protein AYY22_03960 [Photobacterium kishitanii]PSU96141.1 hypothetical protein C0W35_04705 [Photobacterium kishitanii]PSV00041.1 hypothetical protein C9J27_07315 [Photobacterium kishitanii]PSV19282.1 hypothetical protein C0W28_10950 [Photobacterium kishitanii]PSW65687.1 hypothetical protein C0Z01_20660 [Photobacterium kishitanii]
MNLFKLYSRDILGLSVIGFFILSILGMIFGTIALFNYASGNTTLAVSNAHLAVLHIAFIIPALIIGHYINRPSWVAAVDKIKFAREIKQS